jgi:V/A-type H+-transporting ATPase subunit I
MRWRDRLVPVRMSRVAVVAPSTRWRAVLATVADAGVLEPEVVPSPPPGPATIRLEQLLRESPSGEAVDRRAPGDPVVMRRAPDLDQLAGRGAVAAMAGEAELERVNGATVERDGVRAAVGWAPTARLSEVSDRLAPLGGAMVELARPIGVDPPTVLASAEANAFRPLVDVYATVPYRNVDPTVFAAAAYVVMFGMMFGDVGDGLLLIAGALVLRQGWVRRLASLHSVWAMVFALGVSACVFGALYGEFFGPTGVIPVLWLSPLDEPTALLAAAIGVGAVLLAMSFVIGTVNRFREGGMALALYAPTGIAGATLFVALALVAAGFAADWPGAWAAGFVLAAAGLVLAFIGLLAAAGPGGTGVAQAVIELFDLVLRLLANVVSFARLAAFGLTHAALGLVVWDATTALWGGALSIAAVVVFVVGRALSFALEALVAGVQALRLEYYELFSRIFVTEGRPFRPWRVPFASTEEDPC